MEDDVFLIYTGGEQFSSRLIMGRKNLWLALVRLVFGEEPIDEDDEKFDDYRTMRKDFHSEAFWREGGNIWETDWEDGFAVAVRVETLLN